MSFLERRNSVRSACFARPSLAGLNPASVITTRTPIADIADHEGTSAFRRNLEQLSSDAGAKLLRALGVNGDEAELRSASDEFHGHCLALTLLGSYLTDAYNGDIRRREEVSARLAHDLRQGAHARKVMYQSWLGEGPELAVLRILGLFDRPADEKALGALLKSPSIPGLTESSRSAACGLHSADPARKHLLRCERPRSQRGIALGFSSFFRTRTLGFTRGTGWRGAKHHCGRSALYSYAGGALPNVHARIRST